MPFFSCALFKTAVDSYTTIQWQIELVEVVAVLSSQSRHHLWRVNRSTLLCRNVMVVAGNRNAYQWVSVNPPNPQSYAPNDIIFDCIVSPHPLTALDISVLHDCKFFGQTKTGAT